MNDRTQLIKEYLTNVKRANKEAAKKELLKSLLNNLFTDKESIAIINKISLGAEKTIHNIQIKRKTKRGAADTQYESLIIEFENNLSRTGKHAIEQLKEYLVGNFNSGMGYNFTLISTDCITWKVFVPTLSSFENINKASSEDVVLDDKDCFVLNDKNLDDFYFFLDRYLFNIEVQKATLENIQFDFGENSNTYITCYYKLKKHFDTVKDSGEVKVAFEQWAKFLSIAYGSFDASEKKFLIHTYLSIFSKMLAYTILTNESFIDEEKHKEIINGSIFEKLNVHNFIDNDFFHWVGFDESFKSLLDVFRTIAQSISHYEFYEIEEDILKGVYQDLIDIDTRKDLGEYYTPDWLCENILMNFQFKEDSKMLDPACGSGSFLRAAVDKFKSEYEEMDVEKINKNIYGIDIHPLSVQITKTTLLLSFGELLRNLKRPIKLNVYLANTILTPESAVSLYGGEFKVEIDNKKYPISSSIFNDMDLFDTSISVCESLARSSVGNSFESKKTLLNTISKSIGNNRTLPEDFEESIYDVYKGFKETIENGRDSIWKFIILNLYKPIFLKRQFDFVIGNPPWFTYSSIKNEEYQNQLRKLADEYFVTPVKRKNLPHLEIAAIFLSHCATNFLKKGGDIAFVLPRSFLSADHHDNTRKGNSKGFKITQIWDLYDVSPLFRVPSCVIFARERKESQGLIKRGIRGLIYSGKLEKHNAHFREAGKTVSFSSTKWFYSKQGDSSAFTNNRTNNNNTSYYKEKFKQGATIVPRNFYFVEITQEFPKDFDDRVLTVQSNLINNKKAKKPWKDIILKGKINSSFLFRTAIAKNILPFVLYNPELVLLPIELDKDNKITLLEHNDIKEQGFLDTSNWFKKVEVNWNSLRTEKNKEHTYIEYLNWQNKIVCQDMNAKYLVLYTASATHSCASLFTRSEIDLPFVSESTTYWFASNSIQEANYLIAILNSIILDLKIKDFQARGLWGERHIHRKILDVYFPEYDENNVIHKKISKLGKICHKKAKEFIENSEIPELTTHKLGRLRSDIREHLKDELIQIDIEVKKIIT